MGFVCKSDSDCLNGGTCTLSTGNCHCLNGFAEDNCGLVVCPPGNSKVPHSTCSNNGMCRPSEINPQQYECVCETNFTGIDCSQNAGGHCTVTTDTHDDCSNLRNANSGQCISPGSLRPLNYPANMCSDTDTDCICNCYDKFFGPLCQNYSCSQDTDCSGHGTCDQVTKQCNCEDGYKIAINCSFDNTACKNINYCSNNGICYHNDEMCSCFSGWFGNDCSCKNNCVHGTCPQTADTCVCTQGYTGTDCSIAPPDCPNNCSGHGTCTGGKCSCTQGYSGTDCSIAPSDCPSNCSGHGTCTGGKCSCTQGYSGNDCSVAPSDCPNNCSSHGTCTGGKCSCTQGYTGTDCSTSTGSGGSTMYWIIGVVVVVVILIILVILFLYNKHKKMK